MADIFAGGTFERLPSSKAAASIPFFEYAPKAPLPTLGTLARFGKQLNERTHIALVCPKSSWLTSQGAMRKGPELDRGLDWIKRAADILRARAIVIATGRELSTGERDRGLLADFIERLRPTGRLLVAAPRGLWEPEHGSAFARQAQCMYAFDPLESDAPEGSTLYARVQPMGARPRLTDGHLAQIAERLVAPQPERAYVAIESEQSLKDARRLSRLLAETFELAALAEDDELNDDDDDDDEGESEPDADDDAQLSDD